MDEHPIDGWEVLRRAEEMAREGEEFALATVVWRQRPSSGQQGSRAIVTAAGELHGWIGGACAEPAVIREAQRAIIEREPRLLLLGTPAAFDEVPEGMVVIPIACQSDGALHIYVEPVLASPHVVVFGGSPMTETLCELARALGWRADLVAGDALSSATIGRHDMVVVATQGHDDEEALEHAIAARPAYLGLVASRRRGETVLGYLADRGVPREALDRVRVPAGLDLGHTPHREIAVAILAELVQLRAAGALEAAPAGDVVRTPEAIDPVCGMTVPADDTSRPLEHQGHTYHFCSASCRAAFASQAAARTSGGTAC
jgi:xanthine dehydrogenase accessory factor